MTKRIALFLLVAMMAILTVTAVAQQTSIKGIVKDENGKPLVGATLEFNNLDNGSKVSIKTDNHGQYYSIALSSGNYRINLLGSDGKLIFYLNNVPVRAAVENVYDIDLAQERAAAAKESGLSEAQRQKNEKIKKENEKIKGLNALLMQANAQMKDAKWDEAVATMEQAAAMDQTHDVVYSTLAEAYLGDKKYPEAEAAFTKAIQLVPPTSKSIGSYHNGLAEALVKQGKTPEAMAEYDKAAQADPAGAGLYYYNEGAVLTNQGKPDEANQAFDKAIAAEPTRPDPYYQKGLNLLGKATLGKDGKMVPAPGTAEALNKYLELAPDGKYAQSAKDLLASIGAPVQTTFGSQKKGRK